MSYTDAAGSPHVDLWDLRAPKESQGIFLKEMAIQLAGNPQGLSQATRAGTEIG